MPLEDIDMTGVEETDLGPWAESYHGVQVYPRHFTMTEELIPDMLRGLAFTCRFAGQVKSFYSVAQHSVIASYLAEEFEEKGFDAKTLVRQAFLHDVEEWIYGDTIRPVKIDNPEIAAKGERMRREIFRFYGLPLDLDPRVKVIDNMLLACEKRDLKPFSRFWANMPPARDDVIINPMEPMPAYHAVIERHRELFPSISL